MLDSAGAQPHHPVAAPRQRGVVGDQDQRGVAFGVSGEQEVDDFAAGGLVEIAGGLVGDEDRRIGRQCPRQRDPLLFAAGKLRGIVVAPFGKADGGEFSLGADVGIRNAGQFKRYRDVLQGGHRRDEMKGLENDADMAAAEARQRVFTEPAEGLPGHDNVAGVGPFEPGHYHQQRRLAGTRGADEANCLTGTYMQVDALEDMDPRCAASERQVDPGERDRGARRRTVAWPAAKKDSCMPSSRRFLLPPHPALQGVAPRSYGSFAALVQTLVRRAGISLLLLIATAAASPAAERSVKIVALGDSLTAGLGLSASEAFPAKLEKALKARGLAVEIANAGVSGDTASGGLARLDWAVPADTDAVIVQLGANDMLQGKDPAIARRALDEIARRLTERRIAVLLAGMRAAPNLGPEYAREFEAIYPELAAKYDVVFYPFFLDGVAAEGRFNQRDGIHPTKAGVDAIVTGILPKVEELVARVRQRRGS